MNQAFIVFGTLVLSISALAQPAKQEVKFDPPRPLEVSPASFPPIYVCDLQGTGVTLPEGELLRLMAVGDSKHWELRAVEEDRRDFTVRPLSPLTDKTVLNITSDHDTHYAFLLMFNQGHCDSHVTLEANSDLRKKIDTSPAWVPPDKYQAALNDAEAAKRAADEARKKVEQSAQVVMSEEDKFRSEYPATLNFGYAFDRAEAAKFGVEEIFDDGRFLWIIADRSHEPAVLSESKNGQFSAIEYGYKEGVYKTPRLMSAGYLVKGGLGNGKHQEKFHFERKKTGADSGSKGGA